MKILVAIANYGAKNTEYVMRLISEYNSMKFHCDVVILSNVPKDYGNGVEVIVGMPSSNDWSLPFLYNNLFFNRKDSYDLYIYSEDDTLITEENILAFLRMCEVLEVDEIPGFMRYEETKNKTKSISTVHGCFHWLPETVKKNGGYVFAKFTNEHSGCFILTKKQLNTAIKSGGFLTGPHEGLYDMLCSAATVPYTRCDLKKYICLSEIDKFLLHHMPNKYLGEMGIPHDEFIGQINKMIAMAENHCSVERLYAREPSLPTFRFHKKYYGELEDITGCIPVSAKRILTVGCGSGEAEAKLVQAGSEVTAIPVDQIMATIARKKGIDTVSPSFEQALGDLNGRRFDCILLADILQHLENPREVIESLFDYMNPNGYFFIINKNHGIIKLLYYYLKKEIPFLWRIGYEEYGVNILNRRAVKNLVINKKIKSIDIRYNGRKYGIIGSIFPSLVSTYIIATINI